MMEDRHEFWVSEAELKYLRQLVLRDETLANLIGFPEGGPGRKATIQLSLTEAEQLRELLTIQLAKVGFDEDYSPNKEGQMIEKLIDRFYVPSY